MATFGTATFDERGAGGGQGFPGPARRAEVAQTAIPSGGVVLQVINSGGGVTPFTVPAQATAAELNTLRGLVGQSSTLVWAGGTATARLQAIGGAEQLLDDVDLWRFTLNFIGG